MAFVTCGVIPRNGNRPRYLMDFQPNINIVLPKDRKYLMAIDQSSTCTGIYITDTDLSFHFICDFQRSGESPYRFYEELRYFIKRTLKDVQLVLLVMEDLPPMKWRGAGRVLLELKGIINSWKQDIPAFRALPEDRFVDILPQSWKTKIVDKSKGTGRFNNKMEIAIDICDRFPELTEYFTMCPSKDYDSFDACGILHGYIETHFTSSGQKIAGKKSFTGNVIAFYRLIDREDLGDSKEVMSLFEPQALNHGCKVLELNKEQSLYNNILMAASGYPFSITIIDDVMMNLSIRIQHKLGINSKQIVMYILRNNIITRAHLRHLKEVLPYEEIIQ